MKLKVLSALLASAFAGIATTASAGVIQASYKNYASEVFGTDAVVLTAPTINYALALPLSGIPANPNTFSIAWTLTNGGEFVAAPALASIGLTDPSGGGLLAPSAVTLSADKKTISATFIVTSNYTVGSQIVLGSGGPVQVTKVGTILGAPALTNGCANDIASVNVAVKLTNAAGVEFDSNFSLAPLSNTTPIVQASVALSVTATDSATYPDTAGPPVVVHREKGKVDVLLGSLGLKFTAGDGAPAPVADGTLLATNLLNIGAIIVKDKAKLADLGGAAFYSVGTPGFATNPVTDVGIVEASSLKVDVSGNFQTTANGGAFKATIDETCVAAGVAGTIAADGLSATVTLAAADLAAAWTPAVVGPPAVPAGVKPIFLCYVTGGTKVIPMSQFKVTGGSLAKAATSLEAANPVCPGNIYTLSANGVRVDVRNYIPDIVAAPSGGWYNVVRVINTDETQTISPVIQALLADGTLGAFDSLDKVSSVDGKSGPFKPREVRYYFSKDIDGVLNAAATATGAKTYGAADIGGNARLRIAAPSSSIRVQNYHFNPSTGGYLEASAAQSDEGPTNNQLNNHNNR